MHNTCESHGPSSDTKVETSSDCKDTDELACSAQARVTTALGLAHHPLILTASGTLDNNWSKAVDFFLGKRIPVINLMMHNLECLCMAAVCRPDEAESIQSS